MKNTPKKTGKKDTKLPKNKLSKATGGSTNLKGVAVIGMPAKGLARAHIRGVTEDKPPSNITYK